MGLKGCSLWVMGQMNSTCRAPPRRRTKPSPVAAVQVESLRKQTLEPRFHFTGSRHQEVETRALSGAMGQLDSRTCVLCSPHPAAILSRSSHTVERYKLECGSKVLKSGFLHFIGSRVQTRRFQAIGHNWIQLVQPPPHGAHPQQAHGVAAQDAAFESKCLKPGYHISGSRVETRRFQAMGQADSTCTAPPWRAPARFSRCPSTCCIAVQVELKKQILKPGYHVAGSRVETWRFQKPGAFELRGSTAFNLYRAPTLCAPASPPAHSP
jgi:hypothetical protein